MKSMLHEASSIVKAVEKAWADAGKPTEFTIKVLEAGEKNFLGLSKRPAIVSITYEPKRQQTRQQESGRAQGAVAPRANAKNTPAPKPTRPLNVGNKDQIRPLPSREPARQQEQLRPQQKPVQQQKPSNEVGKEQQDVDQAALLVWQDEFVAFIAKELKELLGTWGVKQTFSSKIDKKMLTITLEEHLLDDVVEERNAFMGFSYLLIQFLKRHYKKKFRGFQLIITVKKTTNDADAATRFNR
jgi:predicted RNA-binding protein Jag